jgi:hypothetical protein
VPWVWAKAFPLVANIDIFLYSAAFRIEKGPLLFYCNRPFSDAMRREFFFYAQKIFLLCAKNFSFVRREFFRYAQRRIAETLLGLID